MPTRPPEHLAEDCHDDSCHRFPCVMYKRGYEAGYRDGYDRGWQAGYDTGFPDGIAACPRTHKE